MATQYYTASSLDGFIATVDDSLDWLFQLDDVNDTGYPDFIEDVGALAMGSATHRHAPWGQASLNCDTKTLRGTERVREPDEDCAMPTPI